MQKVGVATRAVDVVQGHKSSDGVKCVPCHLIRMLFLLALKVRMYARNAYPDHASHHTLHVA